MEHRHILHLLPEESTNDAEKHPNLQLSLPDSGECSGDISPPSTLARGRGSNTSNKGNLTDRSLRSLTRSLRRVSSDITRYEIRAPSSTGRSASLEPSDTSHYTDQWYYFQDVEDFSKSYEPTVAEQNSARQLTSNQSDYSDNWKRPNKSRASMRRKYQTSKMCTIS